MDMVFLDEKAVVCQVAVQSAVDLEELEGVNRKADG